MFTVPWEVKLIDITYDFCHRIVTGEEIETALATALRNLIFSPENEAGYKSTLERRSYFPSSDYCVGVCGFSKTELGDDELKKSRHKRHAKGAEYKRQAIQLLLSG